MDKICLMTALTNILTCWTLKQQYKTTWEAEIDLADWYTRRSLKEANSEKKFKYILETRSEKTVAWSTCTNFGGCTAVRHTYMSAFSGYFCYVWQQTPISHQTDISTNFTSNGLSIVLWDLCLDHQAVMAAFCYSSIRLLHTEIAPQNISAQVWETAWLHARLKVSYVCW